MQNNAYLESRIDEYESAPIILVAQTSTEGLIQSPISLDLVPLVAIEKTARSRVSVVVFLLFHHSRVNEGRVRDSNSDDCTRIVVCKL